MFFIDKYGWLVERVKGRKLQNFLRLLIHTRKIKQKCINIDSYNDGKDCVDCICEK